MNLRGTFFACHTVAPAMVRRGSGRIVTINSDAGRHRWPHMSAYSASTPT
ncbi:SDR family NAD(P)-dependent oxidoreductase [Streptomyces anulatus]